MTRIHISLNMDLNEVDSLKYQAGFKLLDKYQEKWQQIHSNSVANFDRIKLVSQRIDSLDKTATKRLHSLDELNSCCKSLTIMDEQVVNIRNNFLQLEKIIPLIESILIELKNGKEQSAMIEKKKEMDVRLQERLKGLSEESASRKEKLRLEHNKRIELFEQRQYEELDERRRILEKTFEEEKQRYLKSKPNLDHY